ncbi:probable pseudouridine-5'-phosphatase [Cimex lectularius]|uniref:Pseudouridine-5'-phosphatase n=1 Tax=Cimex lectularius TaxID=79782 RepID=A0A8I6S228_CIMLE|nr:probable pseudouridine-5'-phosphatase [Cimex lectularius]
MFLYKSVGALFNRHAHTMPTYKSVTHVIFDLDGLILDSEVLYKSTIGAVIASFGKEYTPDLRLAVLGTKEQDTSKLIVEKLKLPVTPEEFGKLAKTEQFKVMNNIPLKPGAEKLINHLHSKKIPIAVATSSGEQSFNLKTAIHKNLFYKFSHVVKGSSDPEVVNGKPAPDIFLIAARRFPDKPNPSNCLVFEDAPNGVAGATAAGMQCVMVPEDYIPKELTTKATLVIKSLLEFLPEQFGLPPY